MKTALCRLGLVLASSVVALAASAFGAQDAWNDENVLPQQFASDWAAAAELLGVQRLYVGAGALADYPRVLLTPLSRRHPPQSRYQAQVLIVPEAQAGRGRAGWQTFAMQRHGRLLVGYKTFGEAQRRANVANVIGIDTSSSARTAQTRDELGSAVVQGDGARALELATSLTEAYPDDFLLFLIKARILAKAGRANDAATAAARCRELLAAAMSRLRESPWLAELRRARDQRRLPPALGLIACLRALHEEASKYPEPKPRPRAERTREAARVEAARAARTEPERITPLIPPDQLAKQAAPWWADKVVIASERFEEVDPEDWSFSDRRIRVEPRRAGRALVVTGSGRATWRAHHVADGRLDFRYRGGSDTGTVAFRLSDGPAGEQAYWLRMEPGRFRLLRRAGREQQQLATANLRLSNDWHDVAIWTEGANILVVCDGRTVFEVADVKPLPAGLYCFSGDDARSVEYADLRFLAASHWLWRIPLGPDVTTQPPKLLEPDKRKGLVTKVGPHAVPLTIKPFLGKARPAPVDLRQIPPSFVHSWGIDIKGFNTFKLDFRTHQDILLEWADGDRLTVVDSAGGTIHTFANTTDLAQKFVTIKPTALDSGRPYVRCYLILETTSLAKRRYMRLRGLVNKATNTGGEEARLVGDDLNYTPALGAFFKRPDGTPVYQPWLKKGANTSPFGKPPLEPKRSEGWYLVGKSTSVEEQGFICLLYYNERRSRVRAYLLNLSLFKGASGYAVKIGLRARDKSGFVDLDGALFNLDPRPQKWGHAVVTVPIWPHNTWAMVEAPMLYPMVKKLPSKKSSPAKNPPPGAYDSVYEDNSTESMQNVLIKVWVTPYFKAAFKGDFVGQAIGHAIQELNSGGGPSALDVVKGVGAAISEGVDWYGKGKDFHGKVQDFYNKNKATGGPGVQKLGSLVALGAGAWGGPLAAVGAGMSIYESFFSQPEPMRLAIELALRGTMTGSMFTEYQPAFHEFYLPGRFNIRDAFFSDQQTKAFNLVDAALPRYDHTMGHLGFRYDPSTLVLRVLRRDFSQSQPGYSKGAFEEYPWSYDWMSGYYFPCVPKPTTAYKLTAVKPGTTPVLDLTVNVTTKVDRLLPIIYNPYAEISPMTPTIVKKVDVTLKWSDYEKETRFWWLQDISWKTHVKPEPNDKGFPTTASNGRGPSMGIKVYNGNASYTSVKGHQYMTEDPLPDGVWMDILPLTSYVPSTYRSFHQIANASVHDWQSASYKKQSPATGKYQGFDPKDPFPLHDVMFYWDVVYFYYGRSRQEPSGSVPRSRERVLLQSPVTIDVTRHITDGPAHTFDKETHKHVKVKSRMLGP